MAYKTSFIIGAEYMACWSFVGVKIIKGPSFIARGVIWSLAGHNVAKGVSFLYSRLLENETSGLKDKKRNKAPSLHGPTPVPSLTLAESHELLPGVTESGINCPRAMHLH